MTADDKENRAPVGIIGAGIAGLAAAKHLQEAGIDYVILEAADRIGGRVFPFEHNGETLQHGAQFVNGESNAIHTIAEAEELLGPSVGDYDFFEDFTELHLEDDHLSESDKIAFTEFARDLEEKYALLAEEEPRLILKDVFQKDYQQFIAADSRRLEKLSSFDALARFYLSYYEMEWAASAEKFALANFTGWDDQNEELEEGDRSFTMKRDGYKRVLERLTETIPKDRIRLGKTVTKIDYENDDSVTLSFNYGASEHFSAVIVTSSLGYLKQHASSLFYPKLPAKKMLAIETIGFGDMQKIFFEWERPFWKNGLDAIKTIGNSSSKLLGRGNLFEVVDSKAHMLVLWMSGRAVATAAAMSDDEVKREVVEHLRIVLKNDAIEEPARILRHCWKADPFILGSYSYLTPESVDLGDANAILAQPILSESGRPLICFAGEATHSSFYQTTCGAYLSGEREAKRLIDSINRDL